MGLLYKQPSKLAFFTKQMTKSLIAGHLKELEVLLIPEFNIFMQLLSEK